MAWQSLLTGNTIDSLEIGIYKNNITKWFTVNANLIENGGKRIYCIMSDISTKKNKEKRKTITNEKKKDKIKQEILKIREDLIKKRDNDGY